MIEAVACVAAERDDAVDCLVRVASEIRENSKRFCEVSFVLVSSFYNLASLQKNRDTTRCYYHLSVIKAILILVLLLYIDRGFLSLQNQSPQRCKSGGGAPRVLVHVATKNSQRRPSPLAL